jgi:hypothetical protein
MEDIISDIGTGIKRAIGLEDGVYTNLIQNVAGVGAIFAAGAVTSSAIMGASLKSNNTTADYAAIRQSVNPVLRLTMPKAAQEQVAG